MSVVVVRAPAKLTLSLRITGVRSDGYHLIDAEMAELDLADELSIDPDGFGLSVSGAYRDGVPLDDSNLVAKALRLAGRSAGVTIDKRIPHGGGLGGGSSDAAAVLRWAGFDDVAAACGLGADVGFCLVGGRARVSGIGEIIEPLPPIARAITLVIPPLSCSTPAVYRAWDALGGPCDDSDGGAANDLTAAALAVEPRMLEWRRRIRDAAGTPPMLAGSGATWFLDGHHPLLAELLPDAKVVLAHTAG